MSNLPTDAATRKGIPLYRGVLKYFPDALCAVAECSAAGNEQHHADKPLHWDKSKSTDEGDSLMRHLIEAGTLDTDGIRHSAKVAWRALALLQREIDAEREEAQADWDAVLSEGPDDEAHPEYQAVVDPSEEGPPDTRLRELLNRERDGLPLTRGEIMELMAADL